MTSPESPILGPSIRRRALLVAVAGVLSTALLAVPAAPPSRAACAPVATPAGGATPPVPAAVAAIPTQAPAAAEVNPPGDIPDTQAFVTYTSAAGGYAIAMPEGWARTEAGPNVVFADKLHTFAVEIGCAAVAPTVNSATATDVPALADTVPAFELVAVEAVDLPAGPAVLIRYRSNSMPDDVTGKQTRLEVDRYELFQDGRQAAISLSAPAGSDNVDVSNEVSRSFRWTA